MASMVNPNLPGAVIDVAPESMPVHMASGWIPLDGKATEAAEAAEAADVAAKAERDEVARKAVEDAKEDKAAAPAKAKTAAKES